MIVKVVVRDLISSLFLVVNEKKMVVCKGRKRINMSVLGVKIGNRIIL